MRAGVGQVEFSLTLGLAMMGYGARTGLAECAHDPLFARALYLEASKGRLLWVSFDVCLIAPLQAEQVRDQIAAKTGLARSEILVACIHTHSGPETGFGSLMTGGDAPDFVSGILTAGVAAAVDAVETAGPASLATGVGHTEIGRNRQREDGPIDNAVRVVRVDDESGRPSAILYSHGCHPTVLGHDNLAWSADWPWAAGLEIQEAFPGAIPIFALGAHADIDPRTRGLQDLARPGRSEGVGFDQVERLGREVGAEVVRVAEGLTPRADPAIGVSGGSRGLLAHVPSPEDRLAALSAVGLDESARPDAAEWYRLEHAATEGLPVAEKRERIATVRRYLRNRTARRFAFGEVPEVEVRHIRLGDFRFLALPLEATVEIGQEWARRTGRPGDGVLSIVGGWMRYLPHPENFTRPGGDQSYEVLQSTFQAQAAETLLELAERLDEKAG